MRVNRVLESCLYVDDLAFAREFFQSILGLELVSQEEGRHVFFRCGSSMVLLFRPEATQVPGQEVPSHGYLGRGHLAFAAQLEEMDAWRSHLEANGVEIEKDVQWPSGGRSLYFRDPAGNSVEIVTPMIWRLE
jgi:catechol 2,3-dioxygenase-like lactoylglutathione lyase family enzyme